MSANGTSRDIPQPAPQSERPRLLPSNRRLRHLQGVTLRNLNLSTPSNRPRGRTIDDDALPYTHKSPRQLLNVQEASKLLHSSSSSDLKATAIPRENADLTPEVSAGLPQHDGWHRAKKKSIRRRSTLDWSNSTPIERQANLEQSINERMTDLFFSLHVEGVREPIYISEKLENVMNPNFRLFDLEVCNPAITRLDRLRISFWARQNQASKWQYLMELSVTLPCLQYLGKDLEHFYHSLSDNCVILDLSDGLYTYVDAWQGWADVATVPGTSLSGLHTKPALSSSYDALMRLSTLDDCIQDALATREKLSADISSILSAGSSSLLEETIIRAKDSLATVNQAAARAHKQLAASSKTRDNLRASLQFRRQAVQSGREAHNHLHECTAANSADAGNIRAKYQHTKDNMTAQGRRICEDLINIYPIEPLPDKPLAFTIRDLHLPNSVFEHIKNEDHISAAFGHVAHLVYLLSFYLATPLPYPIRPNSSTSTISDPISLMAGGRTFPLYMKGATIYRFEYGVFLLNKNIETLSVKLGLTVMDIRQTLPNLKYLLFVATAGKGEIPARRAGGVRAFLRGGSSSSSFAKGMADSVASSRRGSNESTESTARGSLRRKLLTLNGTAK